MPIDMLKHLLWVPHLKLFLDVFFCWFVNSNVHRLETISSIGWYKASVDVVSIKKTDDGLTLWLAPWNYPWWRAGLSSLSISRTCLTWGTIMCSTYCSMVSCVDQCLGECVMCHPNGNTKLQQWLVKIQQSLASHMGLEAHLSTVGTSEEPSLAVLANTSAESRWRTSLSYGKLLYIYYNLFVATIFFIHKFLGVLFCEWRQPWRFLHNKISAITVYLTTACVVLSGVLVDCSDKIVRIIGPVAALCVWPWNKWFKVFTYHRPIGWHLH